MSGPRLRALDADGDTTDGVGRGVAAAVTALRAGGMCVVVDSADREDEGDLVCGASTVTAEQVAFLVRHTTGILCAPMRATDLERLGLPLMVADNTDPHGTAFTVTVDAVGTGTGVSAADRAATFRALANPETSPSDLRRPGHVFPLRYREGGVLKRAGHTEASIDLLTLAGRTPVAVIGELVMPDGSMARAGAIGAFAAAHALPVVTVEDLVRYRRSREDVVVREGSASLPTAYGTFTAVAYRSRTDDAEHLALVLGDVAGPGGPGTDPPLVRVHSECLTGDAFSSQRCDCGHQLHEALRLIADEGRGVVVYLRGQEGRGIGLGHKLRAYALQDLGRDTVDANLELGLPVDGREYGVGAHILADLGVRRLRLITNNPDKYGGLEGYDLDIAGRVAVAPLVTAHNLGYLRTKRDRMGHQLDLATHTGTDTGTDTAAPIHRRATP